MLEDSLTVELPVLVRAVLVRIQVFQPFFIKAPHTILENSVISLYFMKHLHHENGKRDFWLPDAQPDHHKKLLLLHAKRCYKSLFK
jgi:hypothetical protein